MIFQGIEYWNDDGIIHNFKIYDTSNETAHAYLFAIHELLLDWSQQHGSEVPLRMLVDVSSAGLFPLEYQLTYSSPLLQPQLCLPRRYIAYLSDHITDQLLFHRLAQTGGEHWQQQRRLFPSVQVEAACEWLENVPYPNAVKIRHNSPV